MNAKARRPSIADSGTRYEELARLCPARHAIYKFLAAATIEAPSEEMVATLLADGPLPALVALLPDLADLVVENPQAIEAETTRAREDFDALFLVPASRYLKPVESVYAEPARKGLLMGAPVWSALQFYKEAGATPARRGGLLPDHIGVELSFMEFLISEENRGWEKGIQEQATEALSVQARFLASHLGKWVPELGDLMERNANGSFYRGVSRLLRKVVSKDLGALAFLRAEDPER